MLNIMDNSYTTDNSLVKSITGVLQDSSSSVSPIVDASAYSSPIFTSNNGSSGFFSFFTSISWYVWIMIVLILAFLGINIFSYLAQGTQDATSILSPIMDFFAKLFSGTVLETTKQTIDVSNQGINSIANASTDSITQTQNNISGNSGSSYTMNNSNTSNSNSTNNNSNNNYNNNNNIPGELAKTKQTNQLVISPTGAAVEEDQEDALQKALDDAKESSGVEADDSFSSIQKSTGKGGWCYIGEEKGSRSCLQVGVNDLCLSGDIYPTQDVCINPSLRA